MRMRFADCLLDLSARQLQRRGEVIPLEPKVYALLEVLITRRPAVVTNNELDELLWPQVYVERSSLTRLACKLRVALGDTPRGSNLIRTAYKTGYAFCGSVVELSCAATPVATMELVWKKIHAFALVDGAHLAGRDDTCGIVIDASTVSRNHARVTVQSGSATVEDLGSTNGTHVNGVRISRPTPLDVGDALSLGSEVLKVKRRGAAALTVKMVEHKKAPSSLHRRQ